MATLISNANGNLTGAATFAVTEIGTGALNLVRNTAIGLGAASSVTSVTFTVTSGKVIDGVLLFVQQAGAGSTGTFKVDLQKGGVSQASVTVNKTDLPGPPNFSANTYSPVLFKFPSPATGDGGTNWTIVLTTTGTVNVNYQGYTGTSSNFTHALRTTTAQTPAAADDLYIVGELTGAGTLNAWTVTMDSTAATAYGNGLLNSSSVAGGGIHISNYGTLTYGNPGSTSVPATWDAATVSNVTLSNGNLTVTNNLSGSSVDQGARVAAAFGKTSGKWYFEIKFVTNAGSQNCGPGIGTTASTYTGMGNNATVGSKVNLTDAGRLWTNGGAASGITIGSGGTGNTVGIAVDLDNRLIWFRYSDVNPNNWNAGGTASPATGVGGVAIPAGTMVPFCTFGGSIFDGAGNVCTANFGVTAFVSAVPSGFTAGWVNTVATFVPTPGTNYILRVNGDVMVYQFGTLNIGSSAAVSSVNSTLDPASVVNVTVSNGNLTGAYTGAGSNGIVRGTGFKSAGKYYFESTIGQHSGSSGDGVGLLLSTGTAIDVSAQNANVVDVILNTGNIWANGTNPKTIGTIVTGNVVGVAVDLDNHKIWFRNNGGNWNGAAIGSENPATNTGGVTFPSGSYSPNFFWNWANGDSQTANFGATSFNAAAPSGFGNWTTSVSASTAVLEFQQASADGDFGLRCLDNSTVIITGQPRTAGKNVVKCKLTADVVSGNVLSTGGFTNNGNNVTNGSLEASGNSLLAGSFVENASAGTHSFYYNGQTSVTNITQTLTVWLARGSGTNNRYVRVTLGNSTTYPPAEGFFSDIDLQSGTAGTVTAIGTGTATSVSITLAGSGYVVRMTGKMGTVASSPIALLNACSAAGTTSYTGTNTQNFLYDRLSVANVTLISDTIFNVDTDTGWLNGDAVCVAATTRTASECEIYPLNANAGASSFTSALYPFGYPVSIGAIHNGTAPTQAEIGLITRNVKIRSTSNTLMAYVYCTALSTVTASWAEFYYVGAAIVGKRGIEIDGGAVCNPKSINYCSIHDCDSNGFYCNTSTVTSLNVTFSNNIGWLCPANTPSVQINGAVTNNDWTFDSNLIMRMGGFTLSDLGGICTNNTMVGAGTNAGFLFAGSSYEQIGTFSGNTTHSDGSNGLVLNTSAMGGIVASFTAWRNGGGSGITFQTGVSDVVFTNLTLFGNATSQGSINTGSADTLTIRGGIIAGDTSFTGLYAILVGNATTQINLSSVDMSGIGGIFAPHSTYDFNTTGPIESCLHVVANNCKFGAPNIWSATAKTQWTRDSYFSFEKYNQIAGDHRTEMTFGQLRTDSTIYNTAAPSMKMTPNNASSKLESATQGRGIQCAVNSGDTVTVSVWVRKDVTYTGSQPRLIVRANAAIGINTDTVLATYASSTGSWNQISGTTIAATDDGVMEFIVDCDGTSGFVNLDDWDLAAQSPTLPVNTSPPVISGTTQVGQTLSITGNTWTGFPTPTYTYQWNSVAAPPVPPLDAVASVTGAWSFSRNMLTSFGAGTRYTKSGTAIISLNDQSGNSRHFTDQGITTRRPVETTAFPASVLCAAFDGATQYLFSDPVTLSSFISASSGAVVVSVIIDSVSTNSGTSFLNHGIVADVGEYMGLHARNLSGVTLYAYNWDGTEDNATTTVVTGTPYVLMWRHHGGNLYISVNGGTEISLASGNTTILSEDVYLATAFAGGTFCNCKIAEMFTTSDGSQTTALATAVANMKSYVGA